jgi:CTP:molybdopterin cytidylyltransferase MocA
VTNTVVDDAAIDAAAASAFFAEYGDRAAKLPPVAIVIAAFNEEGVIGHVAEALPATVCGLDTVVIVVSDGSNDETAAVARARGALVCEAPVNRGQGAALRLGYQLARDGGAAYIVTTDADGQYNPAEMESVLAPVVAGEADFATGSRTMGSQETRDPVRRLGVRFFAVTISVLTGQHITDTTFGLRAMRAEVTAAVRLEQPQYQASELLIGVMARGFRVVEVPATIHTRRVGKSKKGNNALYGLSFARVVVGTWWRERQRRIPGSESAPDSGSAGSPRPGEPGAAPAPPHAGAPFARETEPLTPASDGAEPLTAAGPGPDPFVAAVVDGRDNAGAPDDDTVEPRSAKST